MSREIKFRAWHQKELRFYYFDIETVTQTYYPGYYHPITGEKDCELTDSTLYLEKQLFTGLKDKNGVEIYEGDIVKFDGKHWASGQWAFPMQVKYIEGSFHPWGTGDWEEPSNRWEVIGNVEEKKELLE